MKRESPSANAFLFWAVTPDCGEYPEDFSLNDDVVGLIRPVDAWWPLRNLDQGFGIGDLTCLDDVYDFRSVVEPSLFMEIMHRCLAAERREVMRELRHLQEPGLATLAPRHFDSKAHASCATPWGGEGGWRQGGDGGDCCGRGEGGGEGERILDGSEVADVEAKARGY